MKSKLTPINNKINKIVDKQQKISDKVSILEKKNKPIVERQNARIVTKDLILRKSVMEPKFDRKTVLTDSHWHYIELLLRSGKGEHCQTALNYWNQAKSFYQATNDLDLISKPLTTYYCFLNATKALLTFKKIPFDLKHGISGDVQNGQIKLQNEFVKLHKKGVLAGLSNYLGQPLVVTQKNIKVFKTNQIPQLRENVFIQTKGFIQSGQEQNFKDTLQRYLESKVRTDSDPEKYTLKDILYNLEFVHRAYKLTFPKSSELFVPIIKPRFVIDKIREEAWLEFQLEKGYSNIRTLSYMPDFEMDEYYKSDSYYLKSKDIFNWSISKSGNNYSEFLDYYHKHRKLFVYIYSTNELWYFKRNDLINGIIEKNSMILILAAMHRLSEMSRYDPNRLSEHLESKHGWLLSEFINKSLYQFIDMISSEISGDDFRSTGFRN